MIKAKIKTPDYRQAILSGAVFVTKKKAVYAAHILGSELIVFLRSLTDTMRPPARAGEGQRRAHPGGWADVRGTLDLSYSYTVEETELGAILILVNTANYSIYLELMDGYYVLSGVDEPGGPVDRILREKAEVMGFKSRG
jgi:hypothetical protein